MKVGERLESSAGILAGDKLYFDIDCFAYVGDEPYVPLNHSVVTVRRADDGRWHNSLAIEEYDKETDFNIKCFRVIESFDEDDEVREEDFDAVFS